MKAMIEAGAAGVHFEDQLASEKKCGHLGGKVLVPTNQFMRTLAAARLAADVCGVPTVLIARTDALSAEAADERRGPGRRAFLTGERTPEGFFRDRSRPRVGDRARLALAPYADLVWFETATPDLERGARVRRGGPRGVPGQAARVQLLAVVQLAEAPRRRDRSPASSASWRRWATGSSSSRWPASTR